MTVKELIVKLQELPQDKEIYIETRKNKAENRYYVFEIGNIVDSDYAYIQFEDWRESGDDIMETLANRDAIDYEECFTTGNYDDQDCHFCPHRGECSGYEEDE